MIGKEKIQDKYPNLMKGMMAVVSTGDAKKSFDSVDMQESNVFPAQEIIFRFEFAKALKENKIYLFYYFNFQLRCSE